MTRTMRLENVKFSSAGSIGTGSMPCGGKKEKKAGSMEALREKRKRKKEEKGKNLRRLQHFKFRGTLSDVVLRAETLL